MLVKAWKLFSVVYLIASLSLIPRFPDWNRSGI